MTAKHLVDHFIVHCSCFAGGFSTVGLDQHKSVGHPALFEGKDRLNDDHVSVSVDALSNACAADSWKKAQANMSCLLHTLAFSSTRNLLALTVWECRGILCDQFDVSETPAALAREMFLGLSSGLLLGFVIDDCMMIALRSGAWRRLSGTMRARVSEPCCSPTCGWRLLRYALVRVRLSHGSDLQVLPPLVGAR